MFGTIGHARLQPGMRTQLAALTDEWRRTIRAGESHTIPPCHDAWVAGDDPFIGLDVLSAEPFARPSAAPTNARNIRGADAAAAGRSGARSSPKGSFVRPTRRSISPFIQAS